MINKRGITLIALIITVIVLLILAGISINAIVGDNGVTAKAKWSGFVHEYETVNEQKEIYKISQQTEKYLMDYEKLKKLNENEIKDLYPLIGERIDINNRTIVALTLKKTISKIDGLIDSKLYKIDLGKINAKVKREYIVNLKTGTLYSIQGESYQGKIWHIPRIGIDKDEIQAQKVTLTYNANAGTDIVTDMPNESENGKEYDVDDELGVIVINITNSIPKRDGYEFKYWQTKIDENEYGKEKYTAEKTDESKEKIEIMDSTILYAIWEKEYELKFDSNANGASVSDMPSNQNAKTITGSAEFTIDETPPSRNDGYKFDGWKEANGTIYQPGDKVKIEETEGIKILYAQWKQLISNTFKLTYDTNGGAPIITAQTSTTTDSNTTIDVDESVMTKNGYIFKGWKNITDTTDTKIYGDSSLGFVEKITIDKNTTLQAQWEYIGSISANKNKLLTDTTITYDIDTNKIKAGVGTISKIEVFLKDKSTNSLKSIDSLSSNFNNTKTIKISDLLNTTSGLNTIKGLTFYTDYVPTLKITTTSNSEITILGTDIKNYTVGNANSLDKLAEVVNGVEKSAETLKNEKIELISDITTNENYKPIGYYAELLDSNDKVIAYSGPYFSGIFEGNNHSITLKSMTTETKYKSLGIFGMIKDGGKINNLTVKGVNNSSCQFIGGIVGVVYNGYVNNCINECKITDTLKKGHGGISGIIEKTSVINCTNKISIYGSYDVGGISGSIVEDCTIKNCRNEFSLGMGDKISSYGYGDVTWSQGTQNYGTCGGISGRCIDATIESCSVNEYSLIETIGGIEQTLEGQKVRGAACGRYCWFL